MVTCKQTVSNVQSYFLSQPTIRWLHQRVTDTWPESEGSIWDAVTWYHQNTTRESLMWATWANIPDMETALSRQWFLVIIFIQLEFPTFHMHFWPKRMSLWEIFKLVTTAFSGPGAHKGNMSRPLSWWPERKLTRLLQALHLPWEWLLLLKTPLPSKKYLRESGTRGRRLYTPLLPLLLQTFQFVKCPLTTPTKQDPDTPFSPTALASNVFSVKSSTMATRALPLSRPCSRIQV